MNATTERQIRLHNSDCLVGMSRIETGSVDLVLCDLPYGTTKCPWDRVLPFGPLWEQYRRILKPRGVLLLFAAQPFATDLINSARKMFRYDLVWEKGTAVGHANANRMPMRSHELVLVFYQRLPKYRPQGLIPLEKPVDLLEYLVRTYTDPGDLVVDNCMGSGSTAVAALQAGRRFVGFETDPKYFAAACRRVNERAEELAQTCGGE